MQYVLLVASFIHMVYEYILYNVCIILLFSVNELLKIKEELTKDRDEKLTEIVELRQSLVEAATKQVSFIVYGKIIILTRQLFNLRLAKTT